MKPIETNVPRPTARSIVRFFHLSGKRHLLLTGSRGCGKTTLLGEILPLLSDQPIPGITTFAQREQGVWLRDNLSGEATAVGVYDADIPGKENKMSPVPEGFLSLGLSALKRGTEHASPWFSLDEIGYLECGCEAYCKGILSLMEQKQLAAVIRKQDLPFLTELIHRPDVCTVDLDWPFADVGCVIMASGLGQRFSGNKLMADFCGKPLVSWILDATDGLFTRRVVVTRHKDVENLCRQRNVDVIFHSLPHRSDTVRLGLEAIGEAVSSCMFCLGDQPLLSRETLQTILLTSNRTDTIWQLSWENIPSAPVLFPKWAFEELRHLPEGKGGNFLAKKYSERVRFAPAQNAWECFDVDSPEDLEQLMCSMP